jgi:hypothetical protein
MPEHPVRMIIIAGNPGAGKSRLAQLLVRALGHQWRAFGLDDQRGVFDPIPGPRWAFSRGSHTIPECRSVRGYLGTGGGVIFEGALVDDVDVSRLAQWAGLHYPSPEVMTVLLRCSVETAFRRRRDNPRDPEFCDREGVRSIDDFRNSFYDPYSPRRIHGTVVLDTDEEGHDQDRIEDILRTVGRPEEPAHLLPVALARPKLRSTRRRHLLPAPRSRAGHARRSAPPSRRTRGGHSHGRRAPVRHSRPPRRDRR